VPVPKSFWGRVRVILASGILIALGSVANGRILVPATTLLSVAAALLWCSRYSMPSLSWSAPDLEVEEQVAGNSLSAGRHLACSPVFKIFVSEVCLEYIHFLLGLPDNTPMGFVGFGARIIILCIGRGKFAAIGY